MFAAPGIMHACIIDQSLFSSDYLGYEGGEDARAVTLVPHHARQAVSRPEAQCAEHRFGRFEVPKALRLGGGFAGAVATAPGTASSGAEGTATCSKS
ncbi:MAG: hypothetical protein QM607_01955 [Microbacterium sp.]